jgi:hypothetical protein
MGYCGQQDPDMDAPPWRQGQFPAGSEAMEHFLRGGGDSMEDDGRAGSAERQYNARHDAQHYNGPDRQHNMRLGPDMGQMGSGG